VLPIGGLKEKLLAAHRHGIYEAVLPKDNEKDLPEIPEHIRKEMKLHFVTSMDEVLRLALEREVEPLPITPGLGAADFLPRPPAEEKITH
ncbi:MAG: S16 family serine protease, partial [Bryobacteraceae bacterium]